MTSHLELSARAALCRQLARREPDSKNLWLAEAERWSHLTPALGAVLTRHDEDAEAWCWKAIGKRKPLGAKTSEMQFELHRAEQAAGGDAFEALLNGLPLEAAEAT